MRSLDSDEEEEFPNNSLEEKANLLRYEEERKSMRLELEAYLESLKLSNGSDGQNLVSIPANIDHVSDAMDRGRTFGRRTVSTICMPSYSRTMLLLFSEHLFGLLLNIMIEDDGTSEMMSIVSSIVRECSRYTIFVRAICLQSLLIQITHNVYH